LGGVEPPAPAKTGHCLSSLRTQPETAVSAAGHCTCSNLKLGLSAFLNQSKRQ
jgi:hypothetical protein